MYIDFAKYAKYSKAGPRYTSYPTAVEFSKDFTVDDYIGHIALSNASERPLSLYVHLPFCQSACHFCACNMIVSSNDGKKERYIDYLFKDLMLLKQYLDTTRPLIQIHFGGGTPTFFSAKQLDRIISKIKNTFTNITADAELSCEIDPRYFDEDQMKIFYQHGFNRLSFGVQDFNHIVQKAVNRVQSFKLTAQAMNIARKYNIKSVNTDIIYGLPYQDKSNFAKTLNLIKDINPDRIAAFSYAHVPWLKRAMKAFKTESLPDARLKIKLLDQTINYFTKNNYQTIGMDHFAKPEDELFKAIKKKQLHRNFQGYTTKGGTDLFGLGISSIGKGKRHYAQNAKDIANYEKLLDNKQLPVIKGYILNQDDLLRQEVIMSLMANFYLDIHTINAKYKINFNSYFQNELLQLQALENDGLLNIDHNAITVSNTGKLLIRNIAMYFDIYLSLKTQKENTFSKTI